MPSAILFSYTRLCASIHAHFVFNDTNAYHLEQFWKSRMLSDSMWSHSSGFSLPVV